MRNRCLQLAAVALATLVFPLASLAQFQPPTEEELKMTAEPKAPGASAIYLYREETTDDNLHFHSLSVRIKVLTEKGKELATVSVPYPKGTYHFTDLRARTIHADGTIIPLDVKPTDLVDQKGKNFQQNRAVFTLPSVEVGSILEYRWQLRYDDDTVSSPYWDVQQPYFVRRAHYLFVPFKYMDRVSSGSRLLYTTMLPKDQQVQYNEIANKYTLDVNNVEAAPHEAYMPPLAAIMEQVKFYYTESTSREDYWKHEGGRWSHDMDHFASQSNTIKDAVSKIVAPGDTEPVKAKKLYDAVMAIENTDYTRHKSTAEIKQSGFKAIKDAEGVWKQQSGTSDEIALLYLAMARSAGLKAYAMTVCNRDQEMLNTYFLSSRQFDDVIDIVSIDGKEVFLDPGKKFTAFGQLDWRHLLAGGMRQSDKGTAFVYTGSNLYKDASTTRIANVSIEKDGTLSGTARITMSGAASQYWRQMAVENDVDEVKKRFNEEMRGMIPDGVTAEFDHFLGLEDYHSVLMGIVKVSGNMGTATGKRVFMPGLFFATRSTHPFVDQAQRTTAIDMGYADIVRDEVTYHLPENFVVESAPSDTTVPWPNHAAFQVKSSIDKNEVTVVRSLAKNFTLLQPTEYPALREFYQKIAAADQQQLVLTVTPTSKGN